MEIFAIAQDSEKCYYFSKSGRLVLPYTTLKTKLVKHSLGFTIKKSAGSGDAHYSGYVVLRDGNGNQITQRSFRKLAPEMQAFLKNLRDGDVITGFTPDLDAPMPVKDNDGNRYIPEPAEATRFWAEVSEPPAPKKRAPRRRKTTAKPTSEKK